MNDPWPETIKVPEDGSVVIGRSSKCGVVVKHAAISGTHFCLKENNGAYSIEDLESRYGTFVNGGQIKTTQLKAGDVIKFSCSPQYVFNGSALEIDFQSEGLEITLSKVGVERNGQTLIHNLNFVIESGTFVGVLGPSGAGKSLLIGCLSSTIIPDQGQVTFNQGTPVTGNEVEFRSQLGIVPQDDLVYGALTVYENLLFSGKLRLPNLAEDELDKRIESALEEVDLWQHREKQVGVLSGGQRKRVSVAIELLMRPRLILLDEPTSGLDPGVAARLMDVLRGLTRKGITIICTTHTLDTMNFFDTLIVLGLIKKEKQTNRVGALAYEGAPLDLYPRFNVRNAADLFEKLPRLELAKAGEARQTQKYDPEMDTDPSAESSNGTKGTLRFAPAAVEKTIPEPPGFLTQFNVVLKRSLLAFKRDKGTLNLTFLQPVLLALVTLLALHNQPLSVSIHFFLVVCALWVGMTLTVREVVRERKLYVRDRLVSLRPNAYILGKIFSALLILLPVAALLLLTGRLSASFILIKDTAINQLESTSVIVSVLILWITGIGGALLGLIISTLSKSERVAVMVLPLALLIQVLLSRVVFGDAILAWDANSPFGPIENFTDYLNGSSATTQGVIVAFGSLLTITRPAAAAMDMSAVDFNANALMMEWGWLLLVGLVYLGALWFLFRAKESKWIEGLR
jgi:ABC-type multidrug transport system ATPase subunit